MPVISKAKPSAAPAVIPAVTARRMLLGGQGLLADPARRATPAAVYRQIEAMGYLQLDTINIVERAHHHIIGTRFDDYRPAMLDKIVERDRKLFEHWTHDASLVPSIWFPYWRVRFERYRASGHGPESWWHERMKGKPKQVLDHVLGRIRDDGPQMSKDFEHDRKGESGTWWRWKPQKAALDYLWRVGTLSVTKRVNFHKVYDLTERVHPKHDEGAIPDAKAHVDWACRAALERLGTATPSELRSFFAAIDLAAARGWCKENLAAEEIVEVTVETVNGAKPRRAFAFPDWKKRAGRLPAAPDRMRLLSPFDPVIRDRDRAASLFGFDYRFEAFVPAPKRKYGYYVLPILEGDALVGRLDPKFHRDRSVLEVRGPWWEAEVLPTKRRLAALEAALGRFARAIGADRFEIVPARRRPRPLAGRK